jgi:FAD-dependent urate hydroxylase
MTRTALVIGGGIAGPATALALHKAGIEPTVYEAHPARADGVGGFLTLGTNGIVALRVLDADERVLAAAFPTPTITLRNGAGRCIGETPTGLAAPPSHTMERADLYAACATRRVRAASALSTASGWSVLATAAATSAPCSPTAARRSATC